MIYVFGDSIAAGQHVPVHQTWPVLLSWRTEGVQLAAHSGDTTRIALERMAYDIQAHRPETLVVQFGLNDANQWDTDGGLPRVSLPAFRENLREIVVRARTFGAKVSLLTNHPTRKSATFERNRLAYNRAIREVCDEHGANLIDIEREWIDGRHLFDAVHLNEAGHIFYAEQVARGLGPLPKTTAHHPV